MRGNARIQNGWRLLVTTAPLALPKPDALVMQGRKLVADRQQALLATLGANYLLLRWTLLARRRAMAKTGKQIRLAGPAEEEDLIGHKLGDAS
jgi:hypothetical protein